MEASSLSHFPLNTSLSHPFPLHPLPSVTSYSAIKMFLKTFLLRILIVSSIAAISSAQPPPLFTCNSTSKCRALIDYIPKNATTIGAVQSLFQIKHLTSLLGANDLPTNTSSKFSLPAAEKIKIPFHCNCSNGTGLSDRHPIYKVQSGDSLDKIAEETFSRLVTFQQITEANRIANSSLIELGQEIWIPLPCSCDEVEGNRVVHYGHLVESGSSTAAIADRFNVSEALILKINRIADPKDLQASQVLDIPLRACSSIIREDSPDYPFLISNGTYDYTANNCVTCRCDATKDWILDCKPSEPHLKASNWSSCPAAQCDGGRLVLGSSTSSDCNAQTCAYAGYSVQNPTIFTNISTRTCPDNRNSATKMGSQGLSWTYMFTCMHLLAFGFLLV